MTRQRTASILAWAAALAFLVTAALHASGFAAVTALARRGPPDVVPIVAMLWLAFSAALALLGLVAAVAAWRPGPPARGVLALAGVFPIVSAVLQLCYFGPIAPAAVLAFDGALALAAAVALPSAAPRAGGAPHTP